MHFQTVLITMVCASWSSHSLISILNPWARLTVRSPASKETLFLCSSTKTEERYHLSSKPLRWDFDQTYAINFFLNFPKNSEYTTYLSQKHTIKRYWPSVLNSVSSMSSSYPASMISISESSYRPSYNETSDLSQEGLRGTVQELRVQETSGVYILHPPPPIKYTPLGNLHPATTSYQISFGGSAR